MRGEEEHIAVVTKDKESQFEALRVALGAVLEDHKADLYILNHKIDIEYIKNICEGCDEEFKDNLEFLEEMGGSLYSNVKENEEFGFKTLSLEEIQEKLKEYGVIIPY
ncbi:hypothetical protein DRP04_03240 [Archaeoglobales archaeon]|nr:MAG: hypothetical protein B6U96_10345 [Archaeoglobales archaeon ex4484_92]RLI82750.1 MAG: hypothetical protein DRP04_03240 [Archaeoglobales archaeon]